VRVLIHVATSNEYVRDVYSDRRFCAIVLVKTTLHGVCVGLPNSTI
jgi:hypothetical protein